MIPKGMFKFKCLTSLLVLTTYFPTYAAQTVTKTNLVTSTLYVAEDPISTITGPVITTVTTMSGRTVSEVTYTEVWTEYVYDMWYYRSPVGTYTRHMIVPGTTLHPYNTTVTTQVLSYETLQPPAIATDKHGRLKEHHVMESLGKEIALFVFAGIAVVYMVSFLIYEIFRCKKATKERQIRERREAEARLAPAAVVELQSFGENRRGSPLNYEPFQRKG